MTGQKTFRRPNMFGSFAIQTGRLPAWGLWRTGVPRCDSLLALFSQTHGQLAYGGAQNSLPYT